MPFTFECGTCASAYRLDEDQITQAGIKITCPKCLAFFYLRKSVDTTLRPVVERVVQDGAYQIQTRGLPQIPDITNPGAPSSAKEEPAPKPVTEVNPARSGSPKSQKRPFLYRILTAELADYPSDAPPKIGIERLFVALAVLAIVISGVFLLHHYKIVHIAPLQKVESMIMKRIEPVSPVPKLSAPPKETEYTPKYGFPIIEDEKGSVALQRKRSHKSKK